MDFGSAFVSSIIAGGKDAYKLTVDRGIKPEYLEGQGREAMEFLVGYVQKHAEIPSRDIILGKTGIDVGLPEGAPSFFIEECLNLRLFKLLKEGLVPATKLLSDNQPRESLEAIQKLVREIGSEQLVARPSESIFKLAPTVLELYDRMKKGERGIPLPFPSLNDATLGVWPQDLVLFVARLGQGKTWSLILCANSAWSAGYKVLLCTTEMSKQAIAQRTYATQLKLPYKDFKRGTLNIFIEDKMRSSLAELMAKDEDRFHVIGGEFNFNPSTLQAEIDNYKPDIVIFDGAYLMQTEGASRNEKAANAFNELKRIANTTRIPFIVSSQFNRDVKKNSPNSVQAESIGLTDVAGWNADVIFGLIQTEDMKEMKTMRYKPLKVREGEGQEFDCIWDIGQMKFEEINKDGTISKNDDPFAAAAPQAAPDPDSATLF